MTEGRRNASTRLSDAVVTADERSFVTVLVADTVGSTASIAGLDPDDAEELLDRSFNRIRNAVEGAGGLLVSFAGDGGVAVFGWPDGLERHADQACTAAWDIQEGAAEENLRIRVGVHSGLVGLRRLALVGGERLDLVGGAVHLAAALEKAAAPGESWVSSATLTLCRSRLVLAPAAAPPVLARDGSHAFRLRARPRPTRAAEIARRYSGPMVGREAELAAIRQAMAAEGAQAIALVGEPGIGKSRLAAAAVTEARAEGIAAIVAAGYIRERSLPFGLARRMTLEALRAEPDSSADDLRRALAAIDGPEDARTAAEAALEAVAGGPGPLGDGAAEAYARLFAFAALGGPTMVVIEDLHDVDPESRRWLSRILAESRDRRLAMLLTARPEGAEEAVAIGAKTLPLGPLDPSEMRALALALGAGRMAAAATEGGGAAHGRTGGGPGGREIGGAATGGAAMGGAGLVGGLDADGPGVDSAALDRLVARASGVPFILEQTVHALAATGGGKADQLPQGVQSLIHARLNALPADAKALAQTLGVLGPQLEAPLARRVSRLSASSFAECTQILADSGILHPAGEDSVEFRHAIIAEACAEMLPRKRRRVLHRAAVGALTELSPEEAELHARIAWHQEQSGDDAGALESYWAACKQARRRSASGSLVLIFDRAVRCMGRLGPAGEARRVDFALAVFAAMIQLGEIDRMRDHLPRILESARAGGRPEQLCAAQCQAGLLEWFDGRFDVGLKVSREAAELAERLESMPLIFAALFNVVVLSFGAGDVRGALEEADALCERLDRSAPTSRLGSVAVPGAILRSYAAWFRVELGDVAGARAPAEEALAMAQAAGETYSEALAHVGLGRTALAEGDPIAALAHFEETRALAERFGYDAVHPQAMGMLLLAAAQAGDAARAEQALADLEGDRRPARTGRGELHYLRAGMASALMALGRADEARAALDEAERLARDLRSPVHIANVLRLRIAFARPSGEAPPEWAEELAAIRARHGLAERI